MPKRLLIIAAHPDDEILGCGGSISKITSENLVEDIAVLFLSSGEGSRSLDKKADPVKIDERVKSSVKALNYLGVNNIFRENFLDNQFDKYPLLDIVKKIEMYSREFKPNFVFTHSGKDLNVDHRISFEGTITAFRPNTEFKVNTILSYEILSNTELNFSDNFSPNIFIDIKDHIKNKIKALQFYESELRNYPHGRSQESIEILSKFRGISSGFHNAEAFELVRSFI
jgi:LmbE family N-acetylglucosaminyl deacetylase